MNYKVKIDKDNKEFAKKFFKRYSLTLSDGINMFLSNFTMDKKLPFDLEMFQEETQKSIKQSQESDVTYNKDTEELMKDIRG